MVLQKNFSAQQINDELQNVISSPVFANSSVLTNFLEFIVAETLAGREKAIKEYTIGTVVLGKKSDFNPQIDAIVRIHAGRLRRALNEYYNSEGRNNELRITVPKGAYIAVIESNIKKTKNHDDASQPLPSTRPVLAAMPFRNISQDSTYDFFCSGLGEFLSTELARFQELSVISYYSCIQFVNHAHGLDKVHELLGANYILTGSILVQNNDVRVTTQLVLADTREQLWANTFTRKTNDGDWFKTQDEIVNQIVAVLGGYYGVIYRDMAKASKRIPHEIQIYDAIYWYYQFINQVDEETFTKACNALEFALKRDPNYALAWAVLGEIYAIGVPMGFIRVEDQIDVAISYSKKALSLDPLSQPAYQALSVCYLLSQNKTEHLKAVEKCIALNPRAASHVGIMGAHLIFSGEFEKGARILRDSLELNPFLPRYHALGFSLYYYNNNDFEEAREWAQKMDMPHVPWCVLLQAASLGQLGRTTDAKKLLEKLLTLVPDIGLQGKPLIGSFILDDGLVNKMIEGLEKAGLVIENK